MIKRYGRAIVVFAIFVGVCSAFIFRLVDLQLINGQEYLDSSLNRVITKSVVKAARGEILDRNCRPIVQNRRVFTIEFNLSAISDLNSAIDQMITIFDECGQDYINNFPISTTAPYVYDESFLASDSSVESFKEFLADRKIEYGAASEVVSDLVDYYDLDSYEESRAVEIAAVRYDISNRSSGSYYIFASDINIETVTAVKENIDEVYGVYIEEEPVRYYTEENFASHIIGYVGRIYADEYAELKDQGYSMDDTIGKEGIEKIMEEYLRGTNGYKYAIRDVTGTTTDIISNEEPKAGNDVILTLDKNLQMIVEDSLENVVYEIKDVHGEEAATSAAAVFLEVDTGDVLAMASYPTYNLETYYEDYDTLSKDSGKPYVNRAIAGLFPPGSTFKMVCAVAALEEAIITPTYTYRCSGLYDYYQDITFSCFNSTAHGNMTVATALQKSCNIFFFDAVRRLGIDTFEKYGQLFGFGQKTGIEFSDIESPGILAGDTYRQSIGAELMRPGEVLLAAIGQSDNSVTPLQLANYAATIANGGVRMVPHIIKSVRNSDTGEIIMETEPEVAADLELSQSTIDAVTDGMVKVAQSGGGLYSAFRDYTITSVAVKTGTAETTTGLPNALIVGFAPAEDPKVAFAVVVEHGGINVGPIVAEVIKNALSYYFSNMDSLDSVSEEGTLNP